MENRWLSFDWQASLCMTMGSVCVFESFNLFAIFCLFSFFSKINIIVCLIFLMDMPLSLLDDSVTPMTRFIFTVNVVLLIWMLACLKESNMVIYKISMFRISS